MQNNNSKLKVWNFTLSLFVFSFAFYTPLTSAATIDFVPIEATAADGTMLIKLRLLPEGESLNAVAGEIVWPSERLELVEMNEENSIISLWIKPPRPESPGRLPFAGLIPGGYGEPDGELLTLVFRARSNGPVQLRFESAEVFLNDDQSTAALLLVKNLELDLDQNQDLLPRWLSAFLVILGIMALIVLWRFVFSR